MIRFSLANWRTGRAEVDETVAVVARAAATAAAPAAREERGP